MDKIEELIREHPIGSVIVVAVVVFLFMLLITVITGVSIKKAEQMKQKLPWGTSMHAEHLTPQELSIYRKALASDPSSTYGSEYMQNKMESPVLVNKLFN